MRKHHRPLKNPNTLSSSASKHTYRLQFKWLTWYGYLTFRVLIGWWYLFLGQWTSQSCLKSDSSFKRKETGFCFFLKKKEENIQKWLVFTGSTVSSLHALCLLLSIAVPVIFLPSGRMVRGWRTTQKLRL